MPAPTITNREQKSRVGLIIAAIVFLAIVLLIWLVPFQNILKFLGWLAVILFFIALLGAVIYLVWEWFFRKNKVDVSYINFKRLVEACRRNNPGTLGNLVLSGDKGHTRKVFGKITGWCRIQILVEISEVDENGFQTYDTHPLTKKKIPKVKLAKEEQDCFLVEKHSFPLNLIIEPDVVRMHPLSHDDLIGDVVVAGFSLMKIGEFWWLHSHYLRPEKIDKVLWYEAKRTMFTLGLADMKEIVDHAIGIDSDHEKTQRSKFLWDIPMPGQNQPPAPPAP